MKEHSPARRPVERIPVIIRKPINKNHLAHWCGQQIANEITKNVDCLNLLHASVEKWVFAQVHNSVASYYGSVEDLSQTCWERILGKLHLYDYKKSQFTTWIGTVCKNVMRTAARNQIRRSGVIVPMEDGMDYGKEGTPPALSDELRTAVMELADQHPRQIRILKAIFGDWTNSMVAVPVDINMRRIAQESRRDVVVVRNFYRNEVRPFICERFGEERSTND